MKKDMFHGGQEDEVEGLFSATNLGENIASKDTVNCNLICGKNTLVIEQWLNEVLTLQVLPARDL